MLFKEEFLSKLRRCFGLNLYEVRIWVALLSQGISTAGELSDIAHVPRSRSYDVLESLEKKGFVVMKLGKPIKYMAVSPLEAINRVKKNIELEVEEKIKRLEAFKESDMVRELTNLHSKGIEMFEPTELSGIIKGRLNLYNHLESVLSRAQKSVTIMTTSEGFLRKVEGFKHIFNKLAKKGVSIRLAAPLTKECRTAAKKLNSAVQVKHIDKPKGRFCIVDGKEAILMIFDDKKVHQTYDSGLWINSPFFASALSSLFELAWKR